MVAGHGATPPASTAPPAPVAGASTESCPPELPHAGVVSASGASGARRLSPGANVAFGLVLAGAAVILAAFALALRLPAGGPRAGDPAPDFTLTTFDGGTVHLHDYLGSVVVINFWASWCEPCADEAADLEAVWREYRDRGVVVLGINYTDTPAAALAYLDEKARGLAGVETVPPLVTDPGQRSGQIGQLHHLSGRVRDACVGVSVERALVAALPSALQQTLETLVDDLGLDVWVVFEQPERAERLIEVASSMPGVEHAEVWDQRGARLALA